MICKKCGADNTDENKFCTNCGNELPKENQQQKNICESCGSENMPTNKYCTICGEELSAPEGVKNEPQRQNLQRRRTYNEKKYKNNIYPSAVKKKNFWGITIGVKPLLIAIVVLLISIGIIAVVNSWSYKSEDVQYPPESKSSNPVVEAKVFDIASRFVCSCGSCGEQSLEKCKCATAVEERQFVRDYLEKKNKPEEIIVALANKYGYLKSEYAKTYNVDDSKTWSSAVLQYPQKTYDLIKPRQLNTQATFANVSDIYSAFRCPCGQCQIDELKNCDCSHKNGAREIKAFVSDLVRNGNYTIDDVIKIVDQKYGGKKQTLN